MIYIVSGYPRSGTSMMMNSILGASKLKPAYCIDREELNDKHSDQYYKLNPGKLLEIDFEDYLLPKFPLEYHREIDGPVEDGRGKLMKIFCNGIPFLWSHSYKIVYMKREFHSWQKSQAAAFREGQLDYRDLDIDSAKKLEILHLKWTGILSERRDVDLLIFDFDDVINNPDLHAQILKKNGWPIATKKFSQNIRPGSRRFAA